MTTGRGACYEFDIRSLRYAAKRCTYRRRRPDLVGLGPLRPRAHHFVALERDGTMGATTVHKPAFAIDLRKVDATGALAKREISISTPARPGH